MPYISEVTLYTDQNPGGKEFSGKVLEDGDPSARYLLVAAGSVLSDADAKKYGLEKHKALKSYDAEQALADREAAVIQRSADLAARGGATIEAAEEPSKAVTATADVETQAAEQPEATNAVDANEEEAEHSSETTTARRTRRRTH